MRQLTYMANAWSIFRNRPRKANAWRAVCHAPDGHVALMLRGTRGPHSLLCLPREDAIGLARGVRLLATDRTETAAEPPRSETLDSGSLTPGERLRLAYSVLRGKPRRADAWLAHYLRLRSGQELLLLTLGTRRERRAHSELPLSLPAAIAFANELETIAESI